MEVPVHDINYLYDCIAARVLLDSTPYAYSALESATETSKDGGAEACSPDQETLRSSSLTQAPQQPSVPSRLADLRFSALPQAGSFSPAVVEVNDDASSQSSSSTDSHSIAEYLLSGLRSTTGLHTTSNNTELDCHRTHRLSGAFANNDDALEEAGSLVDNPAEEDLERAGTADDSGYHEVDADLIDGQNGTMQGPELDVKPQVSLDLGPRSVASPSQMTTRLQSASVSSAPATTASSPRDAYDALFSSASEPDTEPEDTACPFPIPSQLKALSASRPGPQNEPNGTYHVTTRQADEYLRCSVVQHEGRKVKRARFAEPPKLEQFYDHPTIKEEEQDHSSPIIACQPTAPEKPHSQHSNVQQPSHPIPRSLSPSQDPFSSEYCSIYSALYLPSPPPAMPVSSMKGEAEDVKPIVEGPPRIRVADFFAQLPAWLPEMRLENDRASATGGQRRLRMGLRELKNGRDGFEAVKRRK